MRGLAQSGVTLFSINVLLSALVALRLIANGLSRKYPYLTAFLAFSVLRGTFLAWVPLTPRKYLLTYKLTEPVVWIFYFLVTLEIYTLIFKSYPALRTTGRWVLMTLTALSATIALASLYVDVSGNVPAGFNLRFVHVAERGVTSALALLILSMTGFLLWYPMRLPRNIIGHSLLFSMYFLTKSFLLLSRNILGLESTRALSTYSQILTIGCLLGWLILLSRRGEEVILQLRRGWDPEEEERLRGQLTQINAALARFARQ